MGFNVRSLLGRWIIVLATVLSVAATASAEWKEKVLYSFQGVPDGATPAGGVVFDSAGNLYGATANGGSASCASAGQCGTVYQLSPPAGKGQPWTETVLYVFKGHAYNDAATPEGGVILDAVGNIYGTSAYGGNGPCLLLGTATGCGAVYKLSPPIKPGGAWTETVLYNFQGGQDGQFPAGDLVFDSAGNLYGATYYGGGYGSCNPGFYQYCGTVFEMSPPKKQGGKWKEKVLYSFKGDKDGANPNGGLVFDSKGAIYGTTAFGGNDRQECKADQGSGCGTVFELGPPTQKGGAWNEQLIHRFTGTDGASPAGLAVDMNDHFYGTSGGGLQGTGIVFRLAQTQLNRWTETVLYDFTDTTDGRNPQGAVTLDAGGNLYGTALGGAYFRGTAFRLQYGIESTQLEPEHWTFSLLYSFEGAPDATYPTGDLIFDRSGNLYGTTQLGGTGQACPGGCGTVFKIDR